MADYYESRHRPVRVVTKRKYAYSLGGALLAILATMLLLFGLHKGFDRQERAECRDWKAQAAKIADYYLVGWQADQCQEVGVNMAGIPVRRQK